ASPFQSAKQAVDLAAPTVRGSRIRRDPPPRVKVVTAGEVKDQETRNAAIGIVAIALALFVILIGFSKGTGWTPGQYTIHHEDSV
ncbi:MAG: hypothetical protein H0U53_08800, partial [Actinobacteria bacterium]|nr:hypothetical protein [Actinomycetota bacterium]